MYKHQQTHTSIITWQGKPNARIKLPLLFTCIVCFQEKQFCTALGEKENIPIKNVLSAVEHGA
jgi:hypothetical protein